MGYNGPDELCCKGGYMNQKSFVLSNSSMTCCNGLEGHFECAPGAKCMKEGYKAWCEAANTPAPTKKKCLGLGWQAVEEEYDPEAEQCCGEGTWGTPTVCSKDSGCCVSGGTSGTAKCFDQGSQQCCGVVSEMPVVCSLHGGCPSSFSWACPTVASAVAAANSSNDEMSN